MGELMKRIALGAILAGAWIAAPVVAGTSAGSASSASAAASTVRAATAVRAGSQRENAKLCSRCRQPHSLNMVRACHTKRDWEARGFEFLTTPWSEVWHGPDWLGA